MLSNLYVCYLTVNDFMEATAFSQRPSYPSVIEESDNSRTDLSNLFQTEWKANMKTV